MPVAGAPGSKSRDYGGSGGRVGSGTGGAAKGSNYTPRNLTGSNAASSKAQDYGTLLAGSPAAARLSNHMSTRGEDGRQIHELVQELDMLSPRDIELMLQMWDGKAVGPTYPVPTRDLKRDLYQVSPLAMKVNPFPSLELSDEIFDRIAPGLGGRHPPGGYTGGYGGLQSNVPDKGNLLPGPGGALNPVGRQRVAISEDALQLPATLGKPLTFSPASKGIIGPGGIKRGTDDTNTWARQLQSMAIFGGWRLFGKKTVKAPAPRVPRPDWRANLGPRGTEIRPQHAPAKPVLSGTPVKVTMKGGTMNVDPGVGKTPFARQVVTSVLKPINTRPPPASPTYFKVVGQVVRNVFTSPGGEPIFSTSRVRSLSGIIGRSLVTTLNAVLPTAAVAVGINSQRSYNQAVFGTVPNKMSNFERGYQSLTGKLSRSGQQTVNTPGKSDLGWPFSLE